jgi:acetyl/propionyl-CoA carboxylase alpha subunit
MRTLAVTIDGRVFEVSLDLTGSALDVTVDGIRLQVNLPDWDATATAMEWVLVNDRSYEIVFDPDLRWIRAHRGLHRLEVRDREAGAAPPRVSDGRVTAPIPGQITRVMVAARATVAEGQPLFILEAMKMENELRAPQAGRVTAVHVSPGQNVTLHQLLAEIRTDPDPAHSV